ncbi:ribose 5-phosphate isomerase B [Heliobacterium gestii]|uniref:Ribose 5-phosphate isomerase B n=1 Tax=Heliomicrobium gestii TaxID=2699 RepID=A0A845LJX6_HELGE|nr:ribose 5-phosphate isomerase B [Heliomicrobium gestii]MBM7866554.1 ribose 5-phosphate isomerase B [Heliomicrobium gestii]MZP43166.1 ribose 5-phosphate isomerase B [Heliomicrobium gestii]
MKIAIGSDHGGFQLKEEIRSYLAEEMEQDGAKPEVIDMGTFSEESVDYPDYGVKVAKAVVAGDVDFGVVICGTGIGISIAANKVPGIRAALCGDPFSARMAREHNDANVLALGARVVGPGLAREIVAAFFAGAFAGGRHARRVDKLRALEGQASGE